MILLGLDPGVQTGYARADATTQRLVDVRTLKAHQAMTLIQADPPALVIFEDARKRQLFGRMDLLQEKYGAAVREGAGAAKRDSKLWEEFLADQRIPWIGRKPHGTKMGALLFKATTGWEGRTSNHARDAGMLVIGINVSMAQALIRQHQQHVATQAQLAEQKRERRRSNPSIARAEAVTQRRRGRRA